MDKEARFNQFMEAMRLFLNTMGVVDTGKYVRGFNASNENAETAVVLQGFNIEVDVGYKMAHRAESGQVEIRYGYNVNWQGGQHAVLSPKDALVLVGTALAGIAAAKAVAGIDPPQLVESEA